MTTIQVILSLVAIEYLHLEQMDDSINWELAMDDEMKDLGPTKKILGMRISRERSKILLKLSQAEYIEKVFQRFNISETKSVNSSFDSHFRLSKDQSSKTEEEQKQMERTPYALAVRSLMYATICIRPDIAHAVGVVSMYMSDLDKHQWEVVKLPKTEEE